MFFIRPLFRRLAISVVSLFTFAVESSTYGQTRPAPTSRLKEEMRIPWTRSHDRFIRNWRVLGETSLTPSSGGFSHDPFSAQGGEAALQAADKKSEKLSDGRTLNWRTVTSWGDAIDLSDGEGLKRNLVAYAFTTIKRNESGKARLCLASDESIRVWLNGILILERNGTRPLTFDEDQVEVDFNSGDNALLVKLEQHTGPWTFAARVLESGAIPPRTHEIGPSFTVETPSTLVVKTDINQSRATEDPVMVQALAAGGKVLAEKNAPRGDIVRFDTAQWPDGPHELRFTTRKSDGLRYATHLAWYKGASIAAARELVNAGAKANVTTPDGATTKMLADMVLDRLGKEGLSVTGNPWWAIHSTLMEYAEIKQEIAGNVSARARAHGFYRLAWRDENDGSTQYARAYLPIGYDSTKKTPLVLRLHGFNPANPEYVRWWSVDARHSLADVEYGHGEGIIYLEPHGRGNTQYLGIGDQDVVRAIQMAKQTFNVDEDRVYLCGDSMGGWGTWNVSTRHPDLFAAIAPIYGGIDYHSYLTEEQLAALTPLTRFRHEKNSSWSLADSLLNVPIFVLHGDVDPAVNVEWSRYGVRMLQRWGYNVRYMELPGYAHEELNQWPQIMDWFLQQRRVASPRHIRIRSAELQNASAYWASVVQAERPDRFMVVDAEIAGQNTIRVDTQNVLALSLTPSASLIDASKPVKIVWNGQAQNTAAKEGVIALRASGNPIQPLAKNPAISGPIGEIFSTPFAVVVGTASSDPAMNEVCRQKAELFVSFWKNWQRQTPRVFKDAEISAADVAQYSLILIGGPEANLVARRFGEKLPLKLSNDAVTVGHRTFPVSDGRVQVIYPHPLNPLRHVLVVASTSATGLQFWPVNSLSNTEFDFIVEDGKVPAIGQTPERTDLWVAGGWFDRNWSTDDTLVHEGKPKVRNKSETLRSAGDAALLDAYVGNYTLDVGGSAAVTRQGNQLLSKVGAAPANELISVGDDRFYMFEGPMVVTFQKDPSNKVIALTAQGPGGKISGKRIE